MSQIPPNQGQGWIDANGYQQPGFPPPGFWQASDGRWYPPESADPSQFATQQVQPGQGPQQYGPPQQQGPLQQSPQQQGPPQQFQAQPVQQQPRNTSRTGLWIALVVVAALVAGCGAIVIVAVSQANEVADILQTTTTELSSTLTTEAGGSSTTESPNFGEVSGDGGSDVIRCTKLNDEALELEVVNSSSETVNYFVTVAFFDTSGQRVSDTLAFITALRPGERTIEEVFIFEEPGDSCEVIDVERSDIQILPDALADVSACVVTGADFVDDVAGTVSATNSASTNSDYSIDVAIIGGDGVRRGTGFAFIETVRPGETAPSDFFTVVDYTDDSTCEVIAVIRTSS